MPSGSRRTNRLTSSTSKSKNGPRLTCVNCRRKKIRCDGALPSCGICIAYEKECSYDKPPSMTQVTAMAERIKELEQTVRELQSSSTQDIPSSPDAPVVHQENDRQRLPSNNEDQMMSLHQHDTYYTSTSAVDAPRDVSASEPATAAESYPRPSHQQDRFEPQIEPNWEENAIANCAIILNLPTDKIRHLLLTHWNWVHPTFMFIDRAAFIRDAAVGGQYFSPLLLTVICLHSTRFTDQDLTERLFSYTKMLIGHEIHDAPSIPRIQAFLQLSAREIGRGSISQAWLYSGMAFRMALDMGLFATKAREDDGAESIIQRRVSRRLAWSCYLWDKTMSLYLGRSPTLQQAPAWLPDSSQSLSNDDTWSPYGVSTGLLSYRPVPANAEACFQSFCKISTIICDILTNLYGQHSTQNASLFVRDIRNRLDDWYHHLPEAMKMGVDPVLCPCPHVLIQNLLYHTTTILLLRPFRKISACRTRSRDAANAIETLFLSMERTFGFTRVTYLMAYCAYIAATIAVQDAKDQFPGAFQRVDTFVRVLSAIRYTCPGTQRSLDIIKQSVSSPISEINAHPEVVQPPAIDPFFDILNNMPVFPMNYFAPGMDPLMGATNSLFTELDPYKSQWSDLHEDVFTGMSFDV